MKATSESLLSSFHHVLYMGDLNYRLDYGGGGEFRDEVPNDELASRFQRELMYAHNNGDYSSVLKMDQLRRMQELGSAFVDFHEADVQFPPTFKVLLLALTLVTLQLCVFVGGGSVRCSLLWQWGLCAELLSTWCIGFAPEIVRATMTCGPTVSGLL